MSKQHRKTTCKPERRCARKKPYLYSFVTSTQVFPAPAAGSTDSVVSGIIFDPSVGVRQCFIHCIQAGASRLQAVRGGVYQVTYDVNLEPMPPNLPASTAVALLKNAPVTFPSTASNILSFLVQGSVSTSLVPAGPSGQNTIAISKTVLVCLKPGDFLVVVVVPINPSSGSSMTIAAQTVVNGTMPPPGSSVTIVPVEIQT